MAKKDKTSWGCTECGTTFAKWQGQCICGVWNQIVEVNISTSAVGAIGSKKTMAGGGKGTVRKPTRMTEVEEKFLEGFSTGMNEIDRVFGGKVARGSVTALGGEPGQGKSTLLLQIAGNIAKNVGPVLYCAGEEGEFQIKGRANRLGIDAPELYLYNTENLNEVIDSVNEIKPVLLVVDSIQHIGNPDIASELGSLKQVSTCTSDLVTLAKSTGTAVFIVSHVTKDNSTIAGPKTFQHMVDTVLFLEGDANTKFKYLFSRKNRYGEKDLAILSMEQNAMLEIINPSEHLLADRASGLTGSTIVCVPGPKPMLVEVQSLVASTNFENAIPRRTARGVERDRFAIILAVLEKRCKIRLSTKDVFLNIVGGLRLDDTSSDLGIALSIYSADKDIVIDGETTIIGEVGLGGEVRPVPNIESLVKEAERNGFKRFILPKKNEEDAKKMVVGMKIVPVSTLADAIQAIQ